MPPIFPRSQQGSAYKRPPWPLTPAASDTRPVRVDDIKTLTHQVDVGGSHALPGNWFERVRAVGQQVLVDEGLPGKITAIERGTVPGALDDHRNEEYPPAEHKTNQVARIETEPFSLVSCGGRRSAPRGDSPSRSA